MSEVKIKFPDPLDNLLKGSTYAGPVNDFNAAVSTILHANQMPFFPNYTDHGCDHVQKVLETELRLIPKDVWNANLFSEADAAVLICATLLHDLAMHLSENGFLELIKEDTVYHPLPWFNAQQGSRQPDEPWHLLWHEFVAEARCFSDRDLNAIFGSPVLNEPHWTVQELPEDRSKWTQMDHLLVGEFIRRHHPRLAHEIAVYGFPGTTKDVFPTLKDTLGALVDVCGGVARSHGLPLRVLVDYFVYKFPNDSRQQNSVAIYHAALLRIADYLQMDAERAPPILLQLRRPQPPPSIDEWNKHKGVDNISFEHPRNPYGINIHLNSGHSWHTHLQLQELIEGLQEEMDISTAVLSEMFGRLDPNGLSLVRLAKTRVYSNINEPSLLNELPYVPENSLVTADPRLLTLLVEPLYGAVPQIGIRELMQNAIDAVRECECFMENHADTLDSAKIFFADQDSDVLVDIEEQTDGRFVLTVTDKGIGMSKATIMDYFLRAGASFRNSKVWLGEFTDEQGESKVLRSGRFGIGVFAAFLLGDSIDVWTRNIKAPPDGGYQFKVTKETELVEIKCYREYLPVGTLIKVYLTVDNAKKLQLIYNIDETKKSEMEYYQAGGESWDWYALQKPSVARRLRLCNGDEIEFEQKFSAPLLNQRNLPPNWHRIKPQGYPAIFWTYCSDYTKIACNGLRIAEYDDNYLSRTDYYWQNQGDNLYMETPCLAVYDPDVQLPLTIRRDFLIQDFVPFDDMLSDDVLLDYLAYSLVTAPSNHLWELCDKPSPYLQKYPLHKPVGPIRFVYEENYFMERPLFCSATGTAPLDPWLFAIAAHKRLLISGEIAISSVNDQSWEKIDLVLKNTLALHSTFTGERVHYSEYKKFYRSALSKLIEHPWEKRGFNKPYEVSILLSRSQKDPFEIDVSKHFKWLKDTEANIIYKFQSDNWTGSTEHLEKILSAYNWPDINELGIKLPPALPFVMEVVFDEPLKVVKKSRLAKQWEKYIGATLIPFDPEERKALIERVEKKKKIGTYIKNWRKLKEDKKYIKR